MTQTVEGLCSLALGEQSRQIESKNRLLFWVEQFHRLLLDPKARNTHQRANTDERLQFAAEIFLRKLPYKSRHPACRHRHCTSLVTDPIMVPLTKAELPFGLVEQPLAKPDSPLESVIEGRFDADNLA